MPFSPAASPPTAAAFAPYAAAVAAGGEGEGAAADARRALEARLPALREAGPSRALADALDALGQQHAAARQWNDAECVLLEAARVSDLAGDAGARVRADVALARLWAASGEYAAAQGAARRALDAAARTSDAAAIGRATAVLGVIAREAGDLDDAARHLLRAEEVAGACGDVRAAAEVARERAELARRGGRAREALRLLNRAHRLFTQLATSGADDAAGELAALEEQLLHAARRWGEEAEAKDQYTQGHCARVAELAGAMAGHAGPAHGFDRRGLFWFRVAALLHDVGKLGIPAEVLNKPGTLSDAEWALMRGHAAAGAEMLADAEFPWDVRPAVESHHERWDGRGYPRGLAGDAIPAGARILCVADVYDALTSARSYKRAVSHDEAVAIMRQDVGSRFDPLAFGWFEAVAARVAHEAGAAAPNAPPHVAPGAEPHAEPAALPADDAAGAEAPAAPAEAPDDLTGLPLRRAFRGTAERLLGARRTTGRPVSLLVIDVDHFKLVNDTFGHLQGDAVLRLVADQVRAHTRPSDLPARYAGDEFVVLLPGTPLAEACAVADRLRAAVAGAACPRRDGSGEAVRATLSIGVAAAPQHGETLEALFSAADGALYGAKRAGRNAVTPAGAGGAGARPEAVLDCFVGRAEERKRLRALLDAAARGEPGLLAVTGEAGVGKSALLQQLAPDVGVRAGSLLVGHCLEADVRPPFGPWADVVRAAWRGGLAPARPWRALARLVPELAGGSALGESVPNAEPVGALAAHELLPELEQFLTLAAAARPLVVVIDDAQWADAATWDALEYLLARLTDQRLLLCLALRAEDLDAAGDARRGRLSRSARYRELALPRLQPADLTQWLRSALGGQAPDAALVAHLAAQSEGVALFAAHTLRALLDDGRLRWADGRWAFDGAGAEDAALPRAVHDLLARRAARLTRAHTDVLAVAAVLGRSFDAETLAAACDRGEDEVLDALDAGLAAAVLVPAPRDPAALAFAHALLPRVLRAGVNPLRLRRVHERVGRALERRGGATAADVARHFDHAGCAAEAFRTALEAGARAAAAYAYDDAAELLAVARRHAGTPSEAADATWRLAQIAELRGRRADAEAGCAALVGELAAGADALGVRWAARRMRERLRLQGGTPIAEVRAACQALFDEAQAAGAAGEAVWLRVMLSDAESRLGNARDAERLAREAVAEAERLPDLALHAAAAMRLGTTVLDAPTGGGGAGAHAGTPADAVPHFRRALELYTRAGDRHGQLRAHGYIGIACDRAGNHAAAEVAYGTALAIGREIGARLLVGVASSNLGVLLLKTGRFPEAADCFHEARETYAALGDDLRRVDALYNLAHLARAEGDAAGALELYAATVALATQLGHLCVQAGALAGCGLAELDLGATRGAVERRAGLDALLAGRDDWWFQGRELCEALRVRLAAADDATGDAPVAALLTERLEHAERHDPYAALWLAAECAPVLRTAGPVAEATLHRYLVHARALGYTPLAARIRAAG